MKFLTAEYILLLDAVSFADCLEYVGEHGVKPAVLLRIGAELLDWIGYFKKDGRSAFCVKQNGASFRLLELGEDSIKYLFAFLCH